MKDRLTIEEMRKLAQSRGGKCLSTEYVNVYSPLMWQCEKGHMWEAAPNLLIYHKIWCPECSNKKRHTIEEMRILAQSRSGKCISSKYINNRTALSWECKLGHQWEATPENVISRKSWCPICAGVKKLTIEEMRKLAQSRGGECLSNEYINAHSPLLWECEKGHRWEAPSNSVKSGSWCPICAGNRKYIIEEMRKLAQSRGGKCISEEYVNNKTYLLWECSQGHRWETIPENVISRKSWCPICSHRSLPYSIEEMRKIAQERGGKCLSNEYINGSTNLLWECSQGHRWEAAPSNIINEKSWCPKCAGTIRRTIAEMKIIAQERGGKCLSNEYINAQTRLLWQCEKGHRWEAAPKHIVTSHSWCPICAVNFRKVSKIRNSRSR